MKRAFPWPRWRSVAALATLLLTGCGGAKQEAKGPESKDQMKSPSAEAPGTTEQGEQFAMAPSSKAAAGRPKMNASAMQAYLAGLDAFKAGDVAGAQNQF